MSALLFTRKVAPQVRSNEDAAGRARTPGERRMEVAHDRRGRTTTRGEGRAHEERGAPCTLTHALLSLHSAVRADLQAPHTSQSVPPRATGSGFLRRRRRPAQPGVHWLCRWPDASWCAPVRSFVSSVCCLGLARSVLSHFSTFVRSKPHLNIGTIGHVDHGQKRTTHAAHTRHAHIQPHKGEAQADTQSTAEARRRSLSVQRTVRLLRTNGGIRSSPTRVAHASHPHTCLTSHPLLPFLARVQVRPP